MGMSFNGTQVTISGGLTTYTLPSGATALANYPNANIRSGSGSVNSATTADVFLTPAGETVMLTGFTIMVQAPAAGAGNVTLDVTSSADAGISTLYKMAWAAASPAANLFFSVPCTVVLTNQQKIRVTSSTANTTCAGVMGYKLA